METLAEEFGRFPLALSHAANYIHTQQITIADFLVRLHDRPIVEQSGGQRYEQSLQKTWEISFDSLRTESPQAFEWLMLCSYLRPEGIPRHWIQSWLQAKSLSRREINDISDEIFSILQNYSFISYDQTSKTISMHRLLQEALRAHISSQSLRINESIAIKEIPIEIYRQAVKLLQQEGKKAFDRTNPKTWTESIRWLSHVKLLLNFIETKTLLSNWKEYKKELSDIYFQAGSILNIALACYKQSYRCHKKALELRLAHHPSLFFLDIAASYNRLGWVSLSMVFYEESLSYYTKSLEIFKQINKDKHSSEEVLALNNMGILLLSSGKHKDAIKIADEALHIMKEVYGEEPHVDKAYSLMSKGDSFFKMGDYVKAKEYAQDSLTMYEELSISGRTSTDMAFPKNSLGIISYTEGDYKDSAKIFAQTLNIPNQLYKEGIYCFGRAYSFNNLGASLYKQKLYGKALEYFNDSLNEVRKIYREDYYVDILHSFDNVIATLCKLKRYEEALKKSEEKQSIVQTIRIKMVNDDDFYFSKMDTGAPLFIFGSCMDLLKINNQDCKFTREERKVVEKMKGHFEKVLNDVKKIYSDIPNHPYVAFSHNNFGTILYKLEEYDQATKEFNKAKNIFEQLSLDQFLYRQHLALTLNNLGVIQNACGCYEKTETHFSKSLDNYNIFFKNDESHPIIIGIKENIKTFEENKPGGFKDN